MTVADGPRAKTILIIESPGEDRKIIGDFLTSLGFEIIYADRGNDGLKTFSQRAPDLVLVEILLPGMNGLSVCKIIKDQEKWAKVILLSKLYQSQNMRKEAQSKWKADGYLEKPFELHELKEAVLNLIGESTSASTGPEAETGPDAAVESSPAELTLETESAAAGISLEQPASDRQTDSIEPVPGPDRQIPIPDSGVFDPHSLAKLLRRFSDDRQSGVLRLQAGDLSKIVYLIDGQPVYIKSNLRSESLGNLLLSSGRINEGTYQQALSRMKQSGRKLGSVLVELKAITAEELTEAIVDQTRTKLAAVFSWEGGTYEFDAQEPDRVNAPRFPVSMGSVLLKAFDSFVDQEELADRSQSDARLLVLPASGALDDQTAAAISEDDRSLLKSIDDQSTVQEVIQKSNLEQGKAVSSLYRMLTIGMIRLDQPLDPDLEPPLTDDSTAKAKSNQIFLNELESLENRLAQLDDYELLGCQPSDPSKKIKEAYLETSGRFAKTMQPDDLDAIDNSRVMAIQEKVDQAYENIKLEYRRNKGRSPAAGPAAELENTSEESDQRNHAAESEMLYRDGLILLEERQLQKALLKLEQASQLKPDEAEYTAMLGWAIYRLITEEPRTIEDAVGLVRKALVLNAGSELVHLIMARIQKSEGQLAAAIKFYKKALMINPKNDEAARSVRELERQAYKDEAEDSDSKKSLLFRKLW